MNRHLGVTTLALIAAAQLAALPATAGDAGTGPGFKGPVGLQLYSLRAQFTRYGVEPTLKQVKGFGFRIVETAGTYNYKPGRFRESLEAHGLKAVSGHFPYEQLRDKVGDVIAEAKILGLEYVGCAWVPHKDSFDEKECRDAIATFNKAGEALAKEGFKFFYHAHGYEFEPFGDGTLFDLMMKETDPRFVNYEMDVLWIIYPGQDPVKLLKQYKGRWLLMHLKDLRKGVETGDLSGKTDVTNDVPLGTGQVNWPAVLKAAKSSGVKVYFIEDESPTVTEQIPQSLRHLESVK